MADNDPNRMTWPDGVPLFGPCANYVNRKQNEAIAANRKRMRDGALPDPHGDKQRVTSARKQALADWNAGLANDDDA
jgi:hypothetical protein